ncbi:unnamed protein product [Durusdinium trenchii]|uniref:FAD_binding_3 domain-containing protein n=2 Tax=Durusdinium trenchii TaxID=1381693 RepID=A0ABP0SRM2_9DINO
MAAEGNPRRRRRVALTAGVVTALAGTRLPLSGAFVAPQLRVQDQHAAHLQLHRWGSTGLSAPRTLRETARPAFGGRPGGRGPGPVAEPEWLGSLFFGLIILSFIPGPWQVILSPIIGLINLFYMFKFGIFLLAIAAIFGLQWYFEATTMEGQCPGCGALQRASNSEPFNCAMCGLELEAKDGQFVRYMKSGQAPQSPFEKIRDMAEQAAEKTTPAKPKPPSPKSKKSSSEVVDVEVL